MVDEVYTSAPARQGTQQASRLRVLEATIERGLRTFVEVGNAIREIRDEKLYREEFSTFEEYCQERWGWSQRYVNYQVEAANTAEIVGTIVPVSNEAQARELTPLARTCPDAARELMSELVEEYGKRLTAKKIKESVRARMKREWELGRLAPEVAEIIKEIDPSDCDLPTSTRQLNYLAGVDDTDDQIEIASRVAAGEAVSVWAASAQLKQECGEIPQGQAHMEAATGAFKDKLGTGRPESAEIKKIVRAGAMEYVVEFADGFRHTVARRFLLEGGFEKCPHCKGHGVRKKGGQS